MGQELKGMFKKGRLSAPDASRLSRAASSGGGNADVRRWAAKKNPKNMSRDISRGMGKTSKHAQCYSSKVPMWSQKRDCQIMADMYSRLPHEELDKAIDNTPTDNWTKMTRGTPLYTTALGWAQSVGIDSLDNVAVLGLWSDAAPYNHRDTMFMVLCNVLSGSHHDRMWIGCWSKRLQCACGCKGRCTYDAIWRVIAWSMQSLRIGTYPAIRDDGVPFAQAHV